MISLADKLPAQILWQEDFSADGSARASVQGGTPPYQYLWPGGVAADTASGLGAGSYGVTVTDSRGCTATTLVQLTEPPPLLLLAEAGPVTCGDSLAAVSLTTSGGAGGRIVTVDHQPLTTLPVLLGEGAHLIAGADANGCMADTVLVLHIPPVPRLSLPGDTTIRLGETLTVTASTNLHVWQSLHWEPQPDAPTV